MNRNKMLYMKSCQGVTLASLGREFGITRERARQIVEHERQLAEIPEWMRELPPRATKWLMSLPLDNMADRDAARDAFLSGRMRFPMSHQIGHAVARHALRAMGLNICSLPKSQGDISFVTQMRPAWLDGLSNRAGNNLMRGGFTSKEAVVHALKQGPKALERIYGMGKVSMDEIRAWATPRPARTPAESGRSPSQSHPDVRP